MRRWTALLALLVLAVSACGSESTKAASSSSTPSSSTPGTTPIGPNKLTKALLAIENQPKYKPSDWGYLKSGNLVALDFPDVEI